MKLNKQIISLSSWDQSCLYDDKTAKEISLFLVLVLKIWSGSKLLIVTNVD